MRTIQEKYNAILEGNFSKSQFVKDAKRELSQFLSPFNGYEDTVSILKSKGVLFEAAKKEVPHYDKPEPGYSIETIERGVDYELEGMGLMSQETVSEEDYAKAKQKAEKNLKKDPNHYLHLLSGDSKKVDKHDQMVPVKKNNQVDTFNGLKKAELKEAKTLLKEGKVEDLAKKLNISVETLKAAMEKIKKGEMAATDAAAKKAKFSEDAVNEYDQTDAVADYIKDFYRNPKTGISIIDDRTIDDFFRTHPEWEEQADGSEEGMQAVMDNFQEFLSVNTDYVDEKKGKDHDGDGDIDSDDYMMAKDKAIKGAKSEAIGGPDHQKLEDLGYSAGEKALMSIDDKIFNHPNFDSFVGGFMKGFKDHLEASQDYASHSVNEGRRRKMKGGKVVTENDYETGGYVESMGPMLDKVLKQLISVWDEWKSGPATEPAMVPFAKKDLLSYVDSKILEGEEVLEGTNEEHQEIKEAFKAIITKVLQEEMISEAATGNLSRVATSYDDFEGMQTAVNSLENVVTEVESFYAKTKEKIQKVYDSFKDIKNVEGLAVGAMLAPAIESAFKKDLIPVTEKGFTRGLEMPKVKVLETDGIAEEELDEKETVFTPINEALNKELKTFGPDLKKKLDSMDFQSALFNNQSAVPMEAVQKIAKNSKLAGISYFKTPDGFERIEVAVNRERIKDLEKLKSYFSTPEGQYGPDKDTGWVIKNIRNVNPGDIYVSKVGGTSNIAKITYNRAEKTGSGQFGTDQVKSTDKIAAEGKKYKYTKKR